MLLERLDCIAGERDLDGGEGTVAEFGHRLQVAGDAGTGSPKALVRKQPDTPISWPEHSQGVLWGDILSAAPP